MSRGPWLSAGVQALHTEGPMFSLCHLQLKVLAQVGFPTMWAGHKSYSNLILTVVALDVKNACSVLSF